MAEKFASLVNDINLQTKEKKLSESQTGFIIQLLKTENREKILKAPRRKTIII